MNRWEDDVRVGIPVDIVLKYVRAHLAALYAMRTIHEQEAEIRTAQEFIRKYEKLLREVRVVS